MPQPKEGEARKEFVKRCIPIVLEDETAEDSDQAVAVCNSMWEKAQEGKAATMKSGEDDSSQEEPKTPAESVAVKFLRDEDEGAVVGGYIALWGSPETKDLQNDYFTPDTWLGLDEYPTVPALFHHGLDEKVGLSVIGRRVKSGTDDTGAWVEDWLDKSSQYWAMVKPLLDREALFYSPGSAPHLVKREDDGKLASYPIVEDTFTVIPAQHRLRPVEQIKAAYKAAGLDYPLEDDETGGDDAGASCPEADEAAARAIELLARINELTTED
jgi:hypothetical protein